jgi:hypothetical protein
VGPVADVRPVADVVDVVPVVVVVGSMICGRRLDGARDSGASSELVMLASALCMSNAVW